MRQKDIQFLLGYFNNKHLDILSELRATNYLLINLIKYLTGEDLTDDYIRITHGVSTELDMIRIKNAFWWLKKLAQDKTDNSTQQNQE
jgi:hypothetical protein